MCRKPIQPTPKTKSSFLTPRNVSPTAPPVRPYTSPQEVGVSYQQFQEISQQEVAVITVNSQQSPDTQQNQVTRDTKIKKLLQAVCLLAVVAIIITVIITLL
jgi:hypothetical protein